MFTHHILVVGKHFTLTVAYNYGNALDIRQMEELIKQVEALTALLVDIKQELAEIKQKLEGAKPQELTPQPQKFTKFDTKRAEIERVKAQLIATRNKAIKRKRAKQELEVNQPSKNFRGNKFGRISQSKEVVQFDPKRTEIEHIKVQHMADRDKVIKRQRAKQNKK